MNLRPVLLTVDFAAAGAIIGAIAGLLPPLGALAALIWYGIQIYESKTIQRHVRHARLKKIRHRLTLLEKQDDPPSS